MGIEIKKRIIKERTFIDPKDGITRSRFGYRGRNQIAWIIVHYTGDYGAQGKAERTANAMQTWKRTVSTHYLVGDDGIFQCVEDKHTAWHCAACSTNKCMASNSVALGVDLVEHKRDTRTRSVNDRDWYFTEKVLEDGSALIAMLADKYNIPMNRIVRHFDVTGKWCPRPFVGSDVNAVTGETGEFAWQKFLLMIERKRHN